MVWTQPGVAELQLGIPLPPQLPVGVNVRVTGPNMGTEVSLPRIWDGETAPSAADEGMVVCLLMTAQVSLAVKVLTAPPTKNHLQIKINIRVNGIV